MGKVKVSVEAENISSEEISEQVLAILKYLQMAKPELVVKVEAVSD